VNDPTLPTVIFDFGGVLARTEDRAPRAQLAAHFGMTYEELDALIFNSETARQATLGRISAAQHWQAAARRLAWPLEELPALQRAFWGGDELDEMLVDFLRSLRTRWRTALLSNAWDDLRAGLESGWRIADAFDQIFISAELGLAKPDLAIYAEVQRRLQTPPERLIFVDDFEDNVSAARRAGWNAVHFRNAGQAVAEVEAWLARQRSAALGRGQKT